ncbi:MAG: copper-containing nitrite reductase [Cohaesibacter sp.]|nr:copper-containing nitrite reductase [Cohaesibacter sp.]
MMNRRNVLTGLAVAASASTIASSVQAKEKAMAKGLEKRTEEEIAKLPRKKIDLVDPPYVHEHDQIAQGGPTVYEFRMELKEEEKEIDDEGTKAWVMSFNGTVPGPLMVVHEGDYVELTLVNPAENEQEHNIDFHGSTGALGGGGLTHVGPGEQVVLRFKATKVGAFIYHCAPGGPMISWHVVSGMSGALLVLPRDGLKDGDGNLLPYDKIFYVGEQDFYVPKDKDGNYKTYTSPSDSYADTAELMRGLIPSHIVFNGAVGALTGDNAMKAKVGDRCLFVHSQANRDTRPHIIGGHGDFVWEAGNIHDAPARDLETWFIRGGSAGVAYYTFRQPGVYAYVNHNLIEAIDLGATGHIVVEGDWNDDLMKQVSAPGPIKS